MDYFKEIERIRKIRELTMSELEWMLDLGEEHASHLYQAAREVCDEVYGKKVFLKGLIEYTNYCKYNCYYCGIRAGHVGLSRYRMSDEKILERADIGYHLGVRTFVIQGGENPQDGDGSIVRIVTKLREAHPDCAITLGIGERPHASYQAFFEAGADRYLLRHETADREYYRHLHPPAMKQEHRVRCLFDLEEIGYQVGCGMMIGTPGQTIGHLYEDLSFIRELGPQIVELDPFIAQKDTPFSGERNGSAERTLKLISIVRLLNPKVLIPVTTALTTVEKQGCEKGVLAGANVLMLNLNPHELRKKYATYEDKNSLNVDDEEKLEQVRRSLHEAGYEIVVERGDSMS